MSFWSIYGGAIMGGASLLGGIGMSIGSAVNANKARKELQRQNSLIDQLESKNDMLFNKQYYSDVTKRTDMQNMFRMLEENQKQSEARAANQAAIMGATPEMQLAQAEATRKSYADSIAELASNASQLKDAYMSDYMNRTNNIFSQRMGLSDKIAQSWMNLSNQQSQAADNLFTTGANLLGGK